MIDITELEECMTDYVGQTELAHEHAKIINIVFDELKEYIKNAQNVKLDIDKLSKLR